MPMIDPNVLALSGESRRLVQAWLAEFHKSWTEKRLAERVEQLPHPGHPLRQIALVGMIEIDLQRQWALGHRPRIEEYLRFYPEVGTRDTVPPALLWAEYEARQKMGDLSDPADLYERFPRQADQLRQLIQNRAVGSSTVSPGLAHHPTPHPEESPAAPRASASSELPPQFGRYRIIKELGKGGMGTVYLAEDAKLGRQVALKVPQFRPEDGQAVLDRFERVARAAATLNHPNICRVYDVGQVNGVHYLTMEYVEGKPLSSFIRPDKPQPPERVAALIRKLALALQEAPARGIVHRDLKPSNLMINQRKEPVIMDFGLARRISASEARLTKSSSLVGTPAYMAPKQISGDAAAPGPACDIYSLGVIMYELLTGRLPFEGWFSPYLVRFSAGRPSHLQASDPTSMRSSKRSA